MCQDFVTAKNLKFGTNTDPGKSKTKCIIFAKKHSAGRQPKNITLNGDQLPCVSQVKHLGHMLQADNSMKVDIAEKRGATMFPPKSLLSSLTPTQLSCMDPTLGIFSPLDVNGYILATM